MTLPLKVFLAILLVLAGLPLVFYRADRIFIDLIPTAGNPNSIPLESTYPIRQVFTVQRPTITRVGIHFRPTAKEIPAGDIPLSLSQAGKTLANSSVSTAFLDSEGATQFRFDKPVPVDPRLPVTAALEIDAKMDGAVRLQLRQPNVDVDPNTVALFVNGLPQPAPVAYQVASLYRPPLALQAGGLLILGAFLLFKASRQVYFFALPLLYVLPFFPPGQPLLPVYYYSACALTGFFVFSRLKNLPPLPALFGAHIFAFTSWYPLHLHAGRSLYIIIALLPLAAVYISLPRSHPLRRHLLLSLTLMAVGSLLIIDPGLNFTSGISAANPRDVFLDPLQSPLAQKTASSWTHFGAYLGFIPLFFSLWGFFTGALRHRVLSTVLVISFLVSFLPYILSLIGINVALPSVLPHFVIITLFTLALFSAWGFHTFLKFLFPEPTHNQSLALTLAVSLLLFSLLDLWHVSATVLEYL